MRGSLRALFLATVLMIGIHVAPIAAQQATTQQGEGPGNCQTCTETIDGDGVWHHFAANATCVVPGAQCFDCTRDGGCHSIPMPGDCDIAVDTRHGHHWCEGEEALVDLKTLRDAGKMGDESALLRVVNKFPKSMRRTAAGYYVVTNCKGAVVAAFRPGAGSSAKANPGRKA